MPLLSAVDHVVLFKVRDSTDPSKIDAMISNLRSLVTLDIANYLTAGPILRNRSAASESAGFTHLLHSRYRSKADLATYSAHPAHLAVVKENVFTICDDIMAVDWDAKIESSVALAPSSPGSAMRLTLAKPREGAIAADLVRVIDGVRASLPAGVQVSYGENFSPARAKGYEVGFISVFPGLDELDALEGKAEIEEHKEKLKPLLESLMVVDYLIPTASSSL
ncbi:hypothetical protein HPP92_023948 [Vanilla planifolia]|uniref:Stress-response A/B barrel domain-containing protein n=1 Tax=Vanilla planifolia TaxID=51239 RepID=A0A835UCH2_VANPL|nr:hypothetical protein HPP92_023948 [Vanilla planifolia]